MSKHDAPDTRVLLTEPEDLDGHTIEELSDYLDSGRSPVNPAIEQSPGCRIALDALVRLRALTPELLAEESEVDSRVDDDWVHKILSGIALDARAGRRLPIVAAARTANLGITEGAVRGIIRGAENAVSGVIVGKCRFEGDITVPGEPVRVRVDISVPYGEPIPRLADQLRREIASRLSTHTSLHVRDIDVVVHDLQQLPVMRGEAK